jgi:short-subunit dehydrogenase
MREAYDQIKQLAGIPDLVILNAGTFYPTPASEFSVLSHRDIMEVNYFGVLNGFDLVLPDFVNRQQGQIAIVSSLAGYRGLPLSSAYGASKAALINFCETVQPELKQQGVDIRLINPGFVKTPLTDKNEFSMPFLVTAEQAAQRIIKGLASGRFEITFPRPFAFLMKGLRLLPNGLYLKLTAKMLP